MGCLHLKQRNIRIHTEGVHLSDVAKRLLNVLGNPCYSSNYLSLYRPVYRECRIVKVDLKFPSKPTVSSGAQDLISQVIDERSLWPRANVTVFI